MSMKALDTAGNTLVDREEDRRTPAIGVAESIEPISSLRHRFEAYRAAVCALLREEACVAMWRASDLVIRVASGKPLTRSEQQRLAKEVEAAARRIGLSPGSPELSLEMAPANRVDAEKPSGLVQTISLTLKEENRTAGVLCIGAFRLFWSPLQIEVIQRRVEATADTLQAIWSLIGNERDLYRGLLNRSLEGYILCDWHKEILYHNHAALQLLGLSMAEDMRVTLARGMERFGLVEFIDEAIHHGLSELNKIFTSGDGRERIVGVNLRRLQELDTGENGWLFTLRDVTATWEVDRMKSTLSMVSHEINTPLASIQSAADLLLDGEIGEMNKKQKRCLEMVRGDVVRLRHLLRDLLDLSVLERKEDHLDRRRSVKLNYVAQKVVDSFEWTAKERQIDLRVSIPEDLPTVRGDRDRITQVLVNLVDNALRFTGPGGVVELRAREKREEIVVWVRDTGVGIPPEDVERIFENFQQAENQPPGIERGYGLGLSIAREIVRQHGGRIWVESEVGKGSTFYVSFPK